MQEIISISFLRPLRVDSTISAGALVVGAFLKFIVDLIRDLKPREHYNGPDITFSQKSSSTVGEAKKATPVPETAPVM